MEAEAGGASGSGFEAEENTEGWPVMRKASEISTVVQLILTDPS